MKKSSDFIILSVFIILISSIPSGCSRQAGTPEAATIPWIERYGYTDQEIFPLITGGTIPGPRLAISVNGSTQFVLLDLISYGLILGDRTFKSSKFEPQRISNFTLGNTELLVEEGYLHDVKILDMDFNLLYAAIIRRADPPLKAKGWLGKDFFLNGRMTIDMRNRILAFSTHPAKALEEIADPSAILEIDLLKGASSIPGLIKFHGVAGRDSVLMTLDTRSYACRISPELAGELGGGNGRTCKVDSLHIGNILLTDLNCSINEDQLLIEPESFEPIHISIGIEIIGQRLLTLDFKENRMLLE